MNLGLSVDKGIFTCSGLFLWPIARVYCSGLSPCVRLVVLLQMKTHTSSLKCVVCLLAIIGFFIVLMATKLKYYM